MKYGIMFKNKIIWTDLFICSVWVWSLVGDRDAWSSPTEFAALLAAFMRITSTFVLKKADIRAWLPLGIMSACLGLLTVFNTFPGLDTMVRYPFILNGIDHLQEKGYTLMATLIVTWLWGAPIILYFVQLFRKKLKHTDLSYGKLAGGILWSTPNAKFYSAMLLASIAALYAGLAMNARICRFACLTVPAISYWLLCKHYGLKNSRTGWVVISMAIFYYAQIFSGVLRISMLGASLVILILLGLHVYRKTSQLWPALACGLYVGIFLPSLSIGYNPYIATDYARHHFYALTPYNGIFLIKDQTGSHYGLRDRYKILIEPCYERIVPHRSEKSGWYRQLELWDNGQIYLYDLWEGKIEQATTCQETKEMGIPLEERIVNPQENLKAYFDSLCTHTEARLWIHRPDDPDTMKVWKAIDELNLFARGERMSYPTKTVRHALSLMGMEQAYLNSHGGWDESTWNGSKPNPGELFLHYFLKKAAFYCPRMEDLADICCEDKKVGVINFPAWDKTPFIAVLLYKDGKNIQTVSMNTPQHPFIEIIEIIPLKIASLQLHFLRSKSGENFIYNFNLKKLVSDSQF